MRQSHFLITSASRPTMMLARMFGSTVLLGIATFPTLATADNYSQNGTQTTWDYRPNNASVSQAQTSASNATTATRLDNATGSSKPSFTSEDTDQTASAANKKNWDLTVGMGMAESPKYPGSRFYRLTPVPIVSATYKDTYFFGLNGVGINAINWNGLKAGPILGVDLNGRNHHDDSRLNQMGNIEPSANAGGFVSFTKGSFEVSSVVKQAVTHMDSYGLSGNVAASYRVLIIPDKLDFKAGPQIDFADGNYMRTWFGVNAAQSAASGFGAYTPKGGIEDVGINTSLTYHYTQHILLRTFLNVKELTGDAANSPITESATQVTGGLGAAYHF